VGEAKDIRRHDGRRRRFMANAAPTASERVPSMDVDNHRDVRAPDPSELDALAKLWHDGWHDGHAAVVPAELTRRRTLDTFRARLQGSLADVRVVGLAGAPRGFCQIKDDELYQLFVTPEARGSGIANVLLADGEARLSARGVTTAWLACAIGNVRAARFYEKCGWHLARTMINVLDTPEGKFDLEVWRYEKAVG
jgi:GNAT superfamily N-acetyltransferase